MEKLPNPPKVIIRHVHSAHDEHEGGAWKVAMADFALAMMALFIVLWIVNSSDEEQRAEISEYFQDPIAITQAGTEGNKVPSPYPIDLGGSPSIINGFAEIQAQDFLDAMQASDIESLADAIDEYQSIKAKESLEAQIESNPVFRPFKNQMLVDITSKGVRLQLVEHTGRPMFEPGSAELKYYTEDIIWELVPLFMEQKNKLSITGFTGSLLDEGEQQINSWLLSSQRADAARTALMDAGVPKEMIEEVVGKADTSPLYYESQRTQFNRRIAITMLRKKVDDNNSTEHAPFIDERLTTQPDDRQDAKVKMNHVLEDLKEEREKQNNSYDNPPNQEESFWE